MTPAERRAAEAAWLLTRDRARCDQPECLFPGTTQIDGVWLCDHCGWLGCPVPLASLRLIPWNDPEP